MRITNRSGFTLFELLIILVVIGFLIGLLLPAVHRIRLAAKRMQSMNNLRQLALGCHSYYDAHRKFPPGRDANNFSAFAYLLPYVEQANLYRQINFKAPVDANANAGPAQTRLELLISPLDSLAESKKTVAPTSYFLSAGPNASLTNNGGLFYHNSNVKFAQVTDGLSNTLLIGESLVGNHANRAQEVSRQHVELPKKALQNIQPNAGVKDWKNSQNIVGNRGDRWIDGRFLQSTFTATRKINDSKPDVNCGGEGGLSGLRTQYHFVLISLGDGSARTLDTDLDLVTLNALAGRSDNKVFRLP